MPSEIDIERGAISPNSELNSRVNAKPKLDMENGRARGISRTSEREEKDSANTNNHEDLNLNIMDHPLAPLLENEHKDTRPPLAESEADELETPELDTMHRVLGRTELNHKDNHSDPDEVDTVTRSALGNVDKGETTDHEGDEDGKRHDSDEVDYFGDMNGPHLGIESRFDGRPLSAMETSRIVPDVNVYQQKKNLAQGMMDLALLSANANQLRYVIESASTHPYYWPSLVFISLSIIFQILVGIGLIMNSTYNVKNEDDICKADKINNLTVLGIFLITIVNVFIAAFSVAQRPVVSVGG